MLNKQISIAIPDLDGNMLLSVVDSVQDIKGGLFSMSRCRLYTPVLFDINDYQSIKMLDETIEDQNRVHPCIMKV